MPLGFGLEKQGLFHVQGKPIKRANCVLYDVPTEVLQRVEREKKVHKCVRITFLLAIKAKYGRVSNVNIIRRGNQYFSIRSDQIIFAVDSKSVLDQSHIATKTPISFHVYY